MNRIFLAAVCGVCWTLVPLPMGHAQSPPKTRLTKTQNSLTAKAFEAYKAGDYDVAVTMFRSSLELGEANITHLHLGRALFRAGKCDEAVAAYDAVTKAPQVTMPRPADVLGKLAEYRTEVETGCPGTVTFDCTPTSMLVSVDGESERGCEGLTLSLPTGSYVATSEVLGQKVEVPFQVTGTREHRVALKVSARDLIGAALAADAPRDRLPLLSLAAELENPAQAWLLLAQAQADLGQCALALDALDRIEGASSTPEMSPSAARTEREILAGKLARTCYGTLLPQCTMEGMHVQIDDGERVPCDGTATRVVVGSRRVSGLLGDRSVTVQVEVVSGTEQPVTLMLDGDATEGGGTPWAWVTLGGGVASLAAWAAYDAFVLTPTFDDYKSAAADGDADSYDRLRSDFRGQRALSLGLFAVGVVATLTGAVLVGFGLTPGEEPDGAGIWLGPAGDGIAWRTSW